MHASSLGPHTACTCACVLTGRPSCLWKVHNAFMLLTERLMARVEGAWQAVRVRASSHTASTLLVRVHANS